MEGTGICSGVREFSLFLLFLFLCFMSSVCTAKNDACTKCSCRLDGSVTCISLGEFPSVATFPPNTTTLHVSFSTGISVPPDLLQHLKELKYLSLNGNGIKKIAKLNVTNGFSNLITLNYAHNDIESIENGAFDELQQLSILDLSYNKLTEFPSFNKTSSISKLHLRNNPGITALSRQSLQNLPFLKSLYMESTGIREIPASIFQQNTKLIKLYFNKTNTLTTINEDAFNEDLPLETLVLDETSITSLPSIGLTNLRVLSLRNVPNIWQLPKLDSIHEVYLSSYNGFLCCSFESGEKYGKDCTRQNPSREKKKGKTTATTPEEGFSTQPSKTHTTSGFGGLPGFGTPPPTRARTTSGFGGLPGFGTLPSTRARTTSGFGGLPGFGTLPSTRARTTSGFGGLPGFGTLPSTRARTTSGFGGLPGFGTLPSTRARITSGFGGLPGFGTLPSTRARTTSGFGGLPGFGTLPSTRARITSGFGGLPGFGTLPSTRARTTSGFGGLPGFGTQPSNKPSFTNQITFPTFPSVHNNTVKPPSVVTHGNQTPNGTLYQCSKVKVICTPKSDAFHPCEDIMGHVLLTFVSGVVGAVALVANLVVAVILLTSQRRLNVTRFLMCNLAFADFCLGLYIFVLTCVSIATHGNYHSYVQWWQHGAGCKILGFLAVFSSELSLFTLVMMTIERFFAIVYAMHMNTRLSYRKTVRLMIGGWIFALGMAAIPLGGVSGYNKVAICLPFDASNTGSTFYVAFLLFLNGASFVCVVCLYSKMLHVVVSGGDMEGAPKRNDSKVGKRMAILVFTDMACWAPIAFFGLLAALGQTLLTVTQSKILLVFFFPINSVCNPFLYAFFTKAFKREFFAALSRNGFCKFRARKYNGTLSSFLYTLSRRHQSTANESTTPKSKHGSSLSLKQSNLELHRKESKTEAAGNVNGFCNAGFVSGQAETRASPGTVRYVASATGSDQVFFPSTPKTLESKDSPKSIMKKQSTAENPHGKFFPKDDSQLVESDTTEKEHATNSPGPHAKRATKKVSIVDTGVFPKDDMQLVERDTSEKKTNKKATEQDERTN